MPSQAGTICPLLPLRLCPVCAHACIVYSSGIFHCSVAASVLSVKSHEEANYVAQEPPSGANRVIQQSNKQV